MSQRTVKREARIGLIILRYLHGLRSFVNGVITPEQQTVNEEVLEQDLGREGIRVRALEGHLDFGEQEEAKGE